MWELRNWIKLKVMLVLSPKRYLLGKEFNEMINVSMASCSQWQTAHHTTYSLPCPSILNLWKWSCIMLYSVKFTGLAEKPLSLSLLQTLLNYFADTQFIFLLWSGPPTWPITFMQWIIQLKLCWTRFLFKASHSSN